MGTRCYAAGARPPKRPPAFSGVAPDGAVTEKSEFQSLNVASTLKSTARQAVRVLLEVGRDVDANSAETALGRCDEWSNDSETWAVLMPLSNSSSCFWSLGVIGEFESEVTSAIRAAKSRSAAIVSVLPRWRRVRFLSHFDGSTPERLQLLEALVRRAVRASQEEDVCLEMSIDFQPGPSSVGIWM